jgi:hypothetical protein
MEKITSVKVLAAAFNRKTGKPSGSPREESLDLSDSLWKGVKTVSQFAKNYMSFWNDLNPDSEEIVLVQSIRINEDF